MTHLELIGVTHTGNLLQARFVHTFTGADHTLPADQVVIEAGAPLSKTSTTISAPVCKSGAQRRYPPASRASAVP